MLVFNGTTLSGIVIGGSTRRKVKRGNTWISNELNLSIVGNTQDYNIWDTVQATGLYARGATKVTVTIGSGVSVGSTSTSQPALDTGSQWSVNDELVIVNNGVIVGKGGDSPTATGNGNPGGLGLKAQYAVSITNNGTIAGGGGSGAVATALNQTSNWAGAGGGAGFGSGTANQNGVGTASTNGTATNGGASGYISGFSTAVAGGAAGVVGSSNNTGVKWNFRYHRSGTCRIYFDACCCGCGRACGNPYFANNYDVYDWQSNYYNDDEGWQSAGGGGAGAAGGDSKIPVPQPLYNPPSSSAIYGGAAGAATNGASTYITWVSSGSIYGSVN